MSIFILKWLVSKYLFHFSLDYSAVFIVLKFISHRCRRQVIYCYFVYCVYRKDKNSNQKDGNYVEAVFCWCQQFVITQQIGKYVSCDCQPATTSCQWWLRFVLIKKWYESAVLTHASTRLNRRENLLYIFSRSQGQRRYPPPLLHRK